MALGPWHKGRGGWKCLQGQWVWGLELLGQKPYCHRFIFSGGGKSGCGKNNTTLCRILLKELFLGLLQFEVVFVVVYLFIYSRNFLGVGVGGGF